MNMCRVLSSLSFALIYSITHHHLFYRTQVVKKLQQSTEQASTSAAPTCAGPTDVACDFCCGFPANKATLSCLTCLASYCPSHVKPHYTVPVLKAHQLVSATVPLQKKMCTKHNKLMEIYCCSDMTCICYLCTIDEHRGHRTVSAAAQRAQDQVEPHNYCETQES